MFHRAPPHAAVTRRDRLTTFAPIVAALLLSAAPAPANAQDIRWLHQFGSPAADTAQGSTADASGIYVVGQTAGTLPGEQTAGGVDAFVRKYDHDGVLLWTDQFGTTAADVAYAAYVNTSGLYVVGDTYGPLTAGSTGALGDMFVRKYDLDGSLLWTRQLGTAARDAGRAVVADDTALYVVGHTDAAFPGQIHLGAADAYVLKYDLDGNMLWVRQFGSVGGDIGQTVGIDSSGIYVGGWMTGVAFIRKYTSDGSLGWSRQFGAAGGTEVRGMAVGATAVYVGGGTTGSLSGQPSVGDRDGFLQRCDPSTGAEIWTKQFGTPFADGVFAVGLGAEGVYVTDWTAGAFDGESNAGGYDAYVRVYQEDGSVKWTMQFGSAVNDRPLSVAVYGNDAFLAGYTSGTLIGQTQLGNQDAFLLRIEPSNQLPIADAGADHVVEATGSATSVTLDGAGSWDPDTDPISYTWKDPSGTVIGTSMRPTLSLPLGTHAFSLSVDDGQGGTSTDTVSVTVQDTTPPLITVQAPAATTYVLNQGVIADFACRDLASAVTECTGSTENGAPVMTSAPGSLAFTVTARDAAGNTTSHTVPYTVSYSTGPCLGGPGHEVLQPVNADGTSVFKRNRTVPVKFRVCDASGVSIGTPGIVTDFVLFQVIRGTVTSTVNEQVTTTTPDTAFRWAAGEAQWVFNVDTSTLAADATYVYRIVLNDASMIVFQFGLR